jgi:hypothetical protein
MGTEGVRPSNSTVLRRFANAKLETGIPRQEKGTHPSSLTKLERKNQRKWSDDKKGPERGSTQENSTLREPIFTPNQPQMTKRE